eukprot:scaffold4416_cov65-Phaeocystis_antarctica.AAC.4
MGSASTGVHRHSSASPVWFEGDGARDAGRGAGFGLECPWLAQIARAHVDDGCHRARVAGRLLGAACRCVETRGSRRALRGVAEVGPIRVRALLARQRRARAKRAEVSRLAGNARLLALVGLVRAGFALVARAHLGAGRDGAGAALDLLRAARRRGVTGRCAGAQWAVRAGLARLTLRLLPCILERAFSAQRTETHLRHSCDGAGAAGPRRGAARGRGETWLGLDALRGAA